MMAGKTNNGGPAFPAPAGCGADEGMSLRDYFAAKAMQALIAGLCTNENDFECETNAHAAVRAYRIADAMMKARAE